MPYREDWPTVCWSYEGRLVQYTSFVYNGGDKIRAQQQGEGRRLQAIHRNEQDITLALKSLARLNASRCRVVLYSSKHVYQDGNLELHRCPKVFAVYLVPEPS